MQRIQNRNDMLCFWIKWAEIKVTKRRRVCLMNKCHLIQNFKFQIHIVWIKFIRNLRKFRKSFSILTKKTIMLLCQKQYQNTNNLERNLYLHWIVFTLFGVNKVTTIFNKQKVHQLNVKPFWIFYMIHTGKYFLIKI